MSETKLDYEAARRCFECHSLVTDNGVVVGCEVVTDASECPACERNAARVGLELMGAWREVPENLESRDWADQERERIVIINTGKSAIAARHGLPVDEPTPCPECGGCREVPNRQYCLVDRCTVTTCPDHYGHCPVSKPCPTCQGGR